MTAKKLKLLIAVPTYKRPEVVAKFFDYWKSYENDQVTLLYFVEPDQVKDYEAVIPRTYIVPTANNCLLSGQKTHIKEYAIANKYDWVLKLDDDVKAFRTRGKMKPETQQNIKDSLIKLVNYTADSVGAISIPYRNELFPNIEGLTYTKRNMRLQSSYLIRPELLYTMFNNVEDFAQTCYVHSKGYRIPRTGLFGQDLYSPVGLGAGGLNNDSRKKNTALETMELLTLFPGISTKEHPLIGFTPSISEYINTRYKDD